MNSKNKFCWKWDLPPFLTFCLFLILLIVKVPEFSEYLLCRNPVFPAIRKYSFNDYERAPLSPPEGEAAQREHPPDPVFYQPSAMYRSRGGCPGGGG
jgi:hypothetical protein